jgi:lysophospholipase L1-like esterase
MCRICSWLTLILALTLICFCPAEEQQKRVWEFGPESLQPFWESNVMHGESVLFMREAAGGEARALVLFPIDQVLSIKNAAGDTTYEEGRDYHWAKNSREITLPAGSRITSSAPADLLRPANSQQYHLPHRDGKGDIFFGGRLEYQGLQTCITYTHARESWTEIAPELDEVGLEKTIAKLRAGKPLRIVVIGDSISVGCNASGWAGGPPFQPAYPELVRLKLEKQYGAEVSLTNLSVSGMSTDWALTMIDKITEARPDLVIDAFGMNDAAGRSAAEYEAKTKSLVDQVRGKLPDVEFILVATMIGNQDWVSLKQELFPQYRDALNKLHGPGIAVADVTSIWAELLKHKQFYDLTGNGVNHPNDFGHRIYAEVISALLLPDTKHD